MGDCHNLDVPVYYSECFHFQIIITSVNSWTESLEWRLPSRMQCLSIFRKLWLPLYWMQREVEGGTWEFWVNPLFYYFSVYKYITLFSQFIDLQLFFYQYLILWLLVDTLGHFLCSWKFCKIYKNLIIANISVGNQLLMSFLHCLLK